MEQASATITPLLATPLCCDYTLQDLLIFTSILVLAVLVLKAFFRGGHFKVPKVDLAGKYAVVTGGNSGIGAETVKVLCGLGCEVIIGARSKETAEEVIKDVKKTHPKAKVEFIELDLASRNSIDSFAKAVKFPQIDYLVNNAGVMSIPRRKTTNEGFEMQWGVNHLGHFYLTHLLWKKVTASPYFRVINVSSLAHKRLMGFLGIVRPDWQNIDFETDYEPNIAYSRSKLYNVLFTVALAAKVGKRGIVTTLHPGVVRTELMREIKGDGLLGQLVKVFFVFAFPVWWLISKSSFEGCQTTLYTLLSDEVENGAYYADCKRTDMNPNVNEENWKKLWQVSEEKLKIKFEP
jgi:NAD(P)-dependent dehydrogenase (short-subunit alcohol dehydrogenase family)